MTEKNIVGLNANIPSLCIVREKIPRGEILAQLAEECAEIAQAALKLRRVIEQDASPTPITRDEAESAMTEEIADVLVCMFTLNGYVSRAEVDKLIGTKAKLKAGRWAIRIEERDAEGGEKY